MLRGPRLFLSPTAASDSRGVGSALRCFSNKSPNALEYCYRGFSGLLGWGGGGLKSDLVLAGGPWLWIGVGGGPGHSSLGTVPTPRIAFPGTSFPQTPRAQSLLARAPGEAFGSLINFPSFFPWSFLSRCWQFGGLCLVLGK